MREEKKRKHGAYKTRLYHIWNGMVGRCTRRIYPSFKHYGAKGIKICKSWENFEEFKNWAINNGYKENLTIDRIDNNKGYNPENCRWATIKEQENNKTNNHRLTYNGEEKTISEWAEKIGINASTLFTRIKRGWSTERALTTPTRR